MPIARQENDVTIVEVGPRDGLQNEAIPIPTVAKIAFVDALSSAGLTVIEATSFVNPAAVPQLADADEVMRGINRLPGIRYLVLVPNYRGLERALLANVGALALFTAATEEFAAANVGTTISGTFDRFERVMDVARQRGMWVRGYVSVAFGCPYAGSVSASSIPPIVERLLALGCDEICLADTIGKASPTEVTDVLTAVLPSIARDRIALHFHDTAGMALSNIEVALNRGVRIFDSAAGGLGGCPFAPGAPGNLSTELLLAHLHGLGLRTGVDEDRIASAVGALRPFIPRLAQIAS